MGDAGEPTRGRRWVRVTMRVLLLLVIVCVVLLAAGAVWNAWAIHRESEAAGVPGQLYEVHGRMMHLYCTGEGSPTIVLESGLGDDSMIWGKNQPVLAKLTRVCSYDRAGFGWSEARPGVRDSEAITSELHGLVTQAGVARPFLLMGHSIAGIHMREYTARYPGDVMGIVFLDGSTPQQDRRFPSALQKEEKKALFEMQFAKVADALGILRAMGQCDEVQPGFAAYAAWIKADSCHPSQYTSIAREMDAVPVSGDEAVHTGPFGSMPILIFSQDPNRSMAGLPDGLGKEMSAEWNGMQEDLKKLSTHSRRIIATGSSHYIQIDRTELVNREVTTFLNEVRTGSVSPQNGTTIRE